MKMTKCQCHSKTIKLGSLFGKLPRLSKMHEQLSTPYKLHDEEDLEVSLEHVLHTNEERVVSLLQNIFLEHG